MVRSPVLSGDSSKALLPGVTVTLTNTETGVVQTRLSNETGNYNFPSVPFGTKYTVTASLQGFKTAIFQNIEVGLNAAVRVNITMEVGEITSTVDVTANASTALLETGPSIGDVLTRERIQEPAVRWATTFLTSSTSCPVFVSVAPARPMPELAVWVSTRSM